MGIYDWGLGFRIGFRNLDLGTGMEYLGLRCWIWDVDLGWESGIAYLVLGIKDSKLSAMIFLN